MKQATTSTSMSTSTPPMSTTSPPTSPALHQSEAQIGALGKIAWLWMHSPLHERWPVALQRQFIVPPVLLGQYELLERDGLPVAYASWALVSHAVELDYIANASHLPLQDWHSGSRLWFVDWVAPFGKRDSLALRSRLAQRFAGQVARAIRVKSDRRTARVMEFIGPDRRSDGSGARELAHLHGQAIAALCERLPARRLSRDDGSPEPAPQDLTLT